MDAGSGFFEQFIDDYFAECEEHLVTIRRILLRLEQDRPQVLARLAAPVAEERAGAVVLRLAVALLVVPVDLDVVAVPALDGGLDVTVAAAGDPGGPPAEILPPARLDRAVEVAGELLQ